jgi:hypothetical protein
MECTFVCIKNKKRSLYTKKLVSYFKYSKFHDHYRGAQPDGWTILQHLNSDTANAFQYVTAINWKSIMKRLSNADWDNVPIMAPHTK